MFEGVQSRHSTFKAGFSLRGIVVDWSDTQRSALGAVLGEEVAVSLCKPQGIRMWCTIHDWLLLSTAWSFYFTILPNRVRYATNE